LLLAPRVSQHEALERRWERRGCKAVGELLQKMAPAGSCWLTLDASSKRGIGALSRFPEARAAVIEALSALAPPAEVAAPRGSADALALPELMTIELEAAE
jgi:hypothetical protein